MKLKKGLKLFENLQRKEYFDKNQELGENMWGVELPTVGDIADFMKEKNNPKMNRIFEFYENEDSFKKMLNRTEHNYTQEESTEFVRKVMSANNDDISQAGYFYKLLMASADDFRIVEKDCQSNGIEYNFEDIDEDLFNYRIRFMFVNELKTFVRMSFNDFIKILTEKNLTEIHVRTPMSCNNKEKRCLCKRCSGALPKGVTNVGTFTALMVTESATQGALSSMNKGRKENINNVLTRGYDGESNWESINNWINNIVTELQNDNVSARFYEIALLSRVRFDNGKPYVSPLKSSISKSGNIFGSYIFTSNMKDFEKIIKTKEFEDNSLKLQLAINDFSENKIY